MEDIFLVLLAYPLIAASSIATHIAISCARSVHLELRSLSPKVHVPEIIVTNSDSGAPTLAANEVQSKGNGCPKKTFGKRRFLRILILTSIILAFAGIEFYVLWNCDELTISHFWSGVIGFYATVATSTVTLRVLNLYPDNVVVMPCLGSSAMLEVKRYRFKARRFGSYFYEQSRPKAKFVAVFGSCLLANLLFRYVDVATSEKLRQDALMELEADGQPPFYWLLLKAYYCVVESENFKQTVWFWMKSCITVMAGSANFGKKLTLKQAVIAMLSFEVSILLLGYLISPSSPLLRLISTGEGDLLPAPKTEPEQWASPIFNDFVYASLIGTVGILFRITARYDFVKYQKQGEVRLTPVHDVIEKTGELPLTVQNVDAHSTKLPRFNIPSLFSVPIFLPLYSGILLVVSILVPPMIGYILNHQSLTTPATAGELLGDKCVKGFLVMFVEVPVMAFALGLVSKVRGETRMWNWEERWGWDSEMIELAKERK